jgi:hypothetical protein
VHQTVKAKGIGANKQQVAFPQPRKRLQVGDEQNFHAFALQRFRQSDAFATGQRGSADDPQPFTLPMGTDEAAKDEGTEGVGEHRAFGQTVGGVGDSEFFVGTHIGDELFEGAAQAVRRFGVLADELAQMPKGRHRWMGLTKLVGSGEQNRGRLMTSKAKEPSGSFAGQSCRPRAAVGAQALQSPLPVRLSRAHEPSPPCCDW